MSSSAVHFIPIVTTLLAVPFALEIFRRYRAHPERLHLLWWALGIATYGVGTFTESLTSVFGWQEPWVRRFSPFVNLDAVVFLIGGAIVSALRYSADAATHHRMWANVLIAIGAIVPGIGGTATRLGHVEVLDATELVGLLLTWLGYRMSVTAPRRSADLAVS